MKILAESHYEIPFEASTFPGGEQHFRLKDDHAESGPYDYYRIETSLLNGDAIMQLALAVDALRRANPEASLTLECRYLPYARQDRVCNPGEALSLKVMCDLINAMQFDAVEVWDVHSDVSLALLDRVIHVPASRITPLFVKATDVIVAPDAGGTKRALACAERLGNPVVQATKVRKRGKVVDTVVYGCDHIVNRNFLIIDDICDGGATFLALAKILRPLTDGAVLLYVTHGIFSHGLEVFEGVIDQIYCPNVWPNVPLPASNILSVLNPFD